MAMKKKNPDPCVGVHLTLPPKLVEAVDKCAGKRGRSDFFRRAAADALNKPLLATTLPQGRRPENVTK
jgi:hypothetical protein